MSVMKFLGLAILCVTGVAVVWLATTYFVGNYRLAQKLNGLRAAGQPVSLRDLATGPILPEANAATYLAQASADLEAIRKLIEAAEQSPAVRQLKRANMTDAQVRRSPPMVEAYRQAVETYPDVWPLLAQAAACPSFQPPIDFTADGRTFLGATHLLDEQRSAARALRCCALLRLADGEPERALDCCLNMLRLSRRYDQSPALVGFLVSIAVRSVALDTTHLVLRSGPLTPAAYVALAGELERHDMSAAFERALITERAVGLQMWDEMGVAFVYTLLPAGRKDRLSYFDVFDAATAWARGPYHDPAARARLEAAEAQAGAMTELLAPAMKSAGEAVARTQAQLRTLRVLCVLEARDAAGRTGEAKLADLGLPTEVTTDPYNGQPLHLSKTPDGWLIYSVGSDLKDDGGQLDKSLTDVGYGPLPASVP